MHGIDKSVCECGQVKLCHFQAADISRFEKFAHLYFVANLHFSKSDYVLPQTSALQQIHTLANLHFSISALLQIYPLANQHSCSSAFSVHV